MKKVALFLLAASAIIFSCSKTVKIALSYDVQTTAGTAPVDIYVPDSGSYDFSLVVKFLTGNTTDKVSLVLSGLPSDVVATKDTVSGLPTFTGHFMLNTNHAKQAKYTIKVTAMAPGQANKVYNVNMTVIPANCATFIAGTYTGSNACTSRSYTYSATASATDTVNRMMINNLGGYGTGTNTYVIVNCSHDSLIIPSQNIGNGTVLSGVGVFTANKMTIYYSATSTPGGFPETCTATLTK